MPTTGVVTFDAAAFKLRFPEFSTVDSGLLQLYFNEATLSLDNTLNSRVQDVFQRSVLLNLLTAHLTKLNAGSNGQSASDLVGRINSASEGSVSVGSDMGMQPMSAAWFNQTKYGAQYWQQTSPLRRARWVAGPTKNYTGLPGVVIIPIDAGGAG